MAEEYRPRKFLHREGKFLSDVLWIKIQPLEILYIDDWNTRTTGSVQTKVSNQYPTYNFALPNDVSFSQNHEWDTFDTVAGAGREIYSKIKQSSRTAGVVTGGTYGISGYGDKNDSPIVYKDSPRREYSFEIELANEGSPFYDVYKPIRDLLEMGSASLYGSAGNSRDVVDRATNNVKSGEYSKAAGETANEVFNQSLTGFKFPFAFNLTTFVFSDDGYSVRDLLVVRNAVMTSIQPKYSGPFIRGYPSKGGVTLTFKDMSPTYRTSWSQGSSSFIKVTENGS